MAAPVGASKQQMLPPDQPGARSGTRPAIILCLLAAASIVLPTFFLQTNPFQALPPTGMMFRHHADPYDLNSAIPPHAQVWYHQQQPAAEQSMHAFPERATDQEPDAAAVPEAAPRCHAEGLATFPEIADALTSIWTSDASPSECPTDSSAEGATDVGHVGRWACKYGIPLWQAKVRRSCSLLGHVVAREAPCGANNTLRIMHELLQVLYSAALDVTQRGSTLYQKLAETNLKEVAMKMGTELQETGKRKFTIAHDQIAPMLAMGLRKLRIGWAMSVQYTRTAVQQVKASIGMLPDDPRDDIPCEEDGLEYEEQWQPDVPPHVTSQPPSGSVDQTLQKQPLAGADAQETTRAHASAQQPHPSEPDANVGDAAPWHASNRPASLPSAPASSSPPPPAEKAAEEAGFTHADQDLLHSEARSDGDSPVLPSELPGQQSDKTAPEKGPRHVAHAAIMGPPAPIQQALEALSSLPHAALPQPVPAGEAGGIINAMDDPAASAQRPQTTQPGSPQAQREPMLASSNMAVSNLDAASASGGSDRAASTAEEISQVQQAVQPGSLHVPSSHPHASRATPATAIDPSSSGLPERRGMPSAGRAGTGLEANEMQSGQPDEGQCSETDNPQTGQGHAGIQLMMHIAHIVTRALQPAANQFASLTGLPAPAFIWISSTIIAAALAMAVAARLMRETHIPPHPLALTRDEADVTPSARPSVSMHAASVSQQERDFSGPQPVGSTGHTHGHELASSGQPSASHLANAVTEKPTDPSQQVMLHGCCPASEDYLHMLRLSSQNLRLSDMCIVHNAPIQILLQ